MEKNKVSIIVPVYNLEKYISSCIESILNQEYSNIELIIVDDGSTDGSLDVINKYAVTDSRIIVFHKGNGGAASARNYGLKSCSGEFITFIDGDDTISKDYFSKNIEIFNIDTELQWISVPILPVNIKGEFINNASGYKAFIPENKIFCGADSIMKGVIEKKLSGLCCGTIYRRNFLNDLFFNEEIYYEDSYFFIDVICRTKKCATSNYGQYFYLERSGSSQKALKTYKHLYSDYVCEMHRLETYRIFAPKYEDYYLKLESDYYYNFLNDKGKRTEGAEFFFNKYKKDIKVKPKIKLKEYIKYFIYYYGGYAVYKRIKKYIKNSKN